MLPLKESKQLIRQVDKVYTNPFDINFLQSGDQTKLFQVELDPVNRLTYLTISVEEQNIVLTLSAEQAVGVGQWLLEAGHVVNFIEKTGMQFDEGDEDEQ